MRLCGKFSADLATLIKKQSAPTTTELTQVQLQKSNELTIRQLAQIRIQSGNVEGAIEFIQRHAHDEMDWLNAQLKCHRVKRPSIELKTPTPHINVIHQTQTILIDAEAGRIAKIIGQFGVFRAWAYAHAIDGSDGRVERNALENV